MAAHMADMGNHVNTSHSHGSCLYTEKRLFNENNKYYIIINKLVRDSAGTG